MAFTMAARRIFATTHLTIVPTAHARLLALVLACRPLSILDNPSREISCRVWWCCLRCLGARFSSCWNRVCSSKTARKIVKKCLSLLPEIGKTEKVEAYRIVGYALTFVGLARCVQALPQTLSVSCPCPAFALWLSFSALLWCWDAE